jgi:Rod binding domain-containing protein
VLQTQALSCHPGSAASVPQRLWRAAQDFESLLLASLWKTLQNNPLAEEEDTGITMTDWGIEVAAQALARAGGIGISRIVVEQLRASVKVSSTAADSYSRQTGSTVVPKSCQVAFPDRRSAGGVHGGR